MEEILTPRVDIKGVDIHSDKYEIKYAFTSTGFSRVVVFDNTIDRIVGVIYVKDFYNRYLDSEDMRDRGCPQACEVRPGDDEGCQRC